MKPTNPRADKVKQRDLCFTRQHLDMDEVAYHAYALAVSKDSGIFYRDDRRDAIEFRTSKSRICRIAQAVEKKGFMVLLEPRRRMKGSGIFASSKYRVLTHDEWATSHPRECRACPKDGTGFKACQSQNQASPVPLVNSPVPPVVLACPTSGTKTEKNRQRREKEKKDTACPNDGTGPQLPLSSSHTEAATAAGGQHSVTERQSVCNEYFVWLNLTWLNLSLSKQQKYQVRQFIFESPFDPVVLRGATKKILDTLDVTNSYDRAGERLAENLPEKCVAFQKELDRQRAEGEALARQKAEMTAHPFLVDGIEETEDALIELELPQEN